jgi:glucan phosphoethanolaminetransferase (alkaline phosphatase superfamily)
MFCNNCGKQLQEGVTCTCQQSFQPAGGANREGFVKTLGGIADKLGMSLHRLFICAAGVLAILGCFLPWYSVRLLGTTIASGNAFRAKASFFGISMTEAYGLGIIIFILIAAVVAYCFLENKIEPIKQHAKFIFAGAGGVICLLTIISIASNAEDGVRIGFGVILVLLMSAAIGAIPFIKKLEEL